MSTGIRKVKTSDLELKDRLVSIQRVTKVTKGGRTFSFSAIVVVGNEEGIVGHGLGKANEVTTAIAKGVEDAKKNLIKVPIINGTIPHEQYGKYGGAKVFLKPASSGTGVKAGGAMPPLGFTLDAPILGERSRFPKISPLQIQTLMPITPTLVCASASA